MFTQYIIYSTYIDAYIMKHIHILHIIYSWYTYFLIIILHSNNHRVSTSAARVWLPQGKSGPFCFQRVGSPQPHTHSTSPVALEKNTHGLSLFLCPFTYYTGTHTRARLPVNGPYRFEKMTTIIRPRVCMCVCAICIGDKSDQTEEKPVRGRRLF